MFLFHPLNWGRVAGKSGSDVGGTVPLLILRAFVCFQPAPVLPLGGCIDIVMFDYVPFPVFTNTSGTTHFQILEVIWRKAYLEDHKSIGRGRHF